MITTESKLWNVSGQKRQCNKVNLGCGNNKWANFINVDVDANLEPDVVCNICFQKLPIVDGTISELWCCHTIEHIPKKYWPSVLFEVNRVLKTGGMFYLTFPEFLKCVELWQANYRGNKDYYEACIYGRQASQWDAHVSICHTPDMKYMLTQYGFSDFTCSQELEPQYSAIKCIKSGNTITKEDVLRAAVFNK